jgi:outer membrane protein assembly factor BamB
MEEAAMSGNRRVFINHAPEDAARCAPLLAALDAWGIDYWFGSRPPGDGQQLDPAVQKAIAERDVFLRVCTGALQRSFAMSLQTNAFLGLQAEDRKRRSGVKRTLVNLILAGDYVREPFDNATLFIDGVSHPRPVWLGQLGRALGVTTPVGSRSRVSRRALLGYGAAAAVTVASTTAAGVLYVDNQQQAQQLKYPPGKIVWQMKNVTGKKDLPPAPAVIGNMLFIATGTQLIAYDFSTRRELWHKEYSPKFAYVVPDVDNGIVYAGVDNGVYALNAGNGSLRWQSYLPQSDTGNVFTTPLVADGNLYILSDSGNLYALRAKDGSQRWSDPIDLTPFPLSDVASAPVVAGGAIFLGSIDHTLYAFKENDGSPKWRFLARGKIVSTPQVANGVVYFGSTDSYVYALYASDGSLKWKYRTEGEVESTPNVVDGVVYIGSDDDYLYALDADTGQPYWRTPIGDLNTSDGVVENSGSIYCQPAVTGDAVVAIDHSYYVVRSYNRRDGKPRWTFKPSNTTQNVDPVAANGLILFGSGDQNLYAFGA